MSRSSRIRAARSVSPVRSSVTDARYCTTLRSVREPARNALSTSRRPSWMTLEAPPSVGRRSRAEPAPPSGGEVADPTTTERAPDPDSDTELDRIRALRKTQKDRHAKAL